MTTLMQHTAQTIVQQKIMGNPHLNHHEAVGPGFESRLVSLQTLSFYWKKKSVKILQEIVPFF